MSIPQESLQEETRVWRCLGPISSGGTVFGLAISPVPDVQRYFAATGCGIFYSDDGGATWRQNLTGLTTPLLSALDTSPNGALFAGALGGDIVCSFDFGKTWEASRVPEEYRATVTVIAASPSFRKDGSAFAATDGGGLLVTRNSGQSWEDSSFGLGDESVLALACSQDWSRREEMLAATTEGVFFSVNGGRAWRESDLMLDDDVVDALAVSPTFERDRTAFAGTENGSLYRSTNGGRGWELLHEAIGDGPVNCLWLAPNFGERGSIVAGVGAQIVCSSDGGETWDAPVAMPGSVLALTGDSDVVLAGLHDAGIFKSEDGGATWISSSEGLSARGFAQLSVQGDQLFVMGPQEGLWHSLAENVEWQSVPNLESYLPFAAISVVSQSTLFVASQEDGILRTTDAGSAWQVTSPVPGVQALVVLADNAGGWAGTADGKLLATDDGGASWHEIESPCEGQEILSIVASPAFADDHTLFMGTSIAGTGNRQPRVALWRSTNAGQSWRQITTQMTPARWVDIAMPVGVQEDVAGQAIVATGPFCLRPLRRAKDVWISTRVDPSGANNLSVAALGEIDAGGQLYSATGNGVYNSQDGGRTWQQFSSGLGSQSFISITVGPGQERKLYALSLGGLVWVCDLD